MKIILLTEYVENIFLELRNLFPEVFLNRNIEEEFKNNPFSKYYILYKEDNIIGFLNYNVMYDKAEIVNINILKEYQGNYYSKLLMDELIDYVNNNNICNITLEVNKNNNKAINLYKKYNFVEIGIRKGYYNGIDAILMERKC